jgi:predicted MFS family arabinose efflux permease
VPDQVPNPNPNVRRGGASTIVAAALLLVALGLVVLYTSRVAFLSPLALVVVAAIGIAALLLQVRLRLDSRSRNPKTSSRGSLWFTALGVAFALGAVFGDVLHFKPWFMLTTALAAVVCFAISGTALLKLLRKTHIQARQPTE